MSLAVTIILGIIGIAILILSAEFVVKQCLALAHYYGISDTFIGLTVLSVGTSLPEIASHATASFQILAKPTDIEFYEVVSGLVLGANIGSDVVQQTLVVGLVVLIGGTMVFTKKFLKQSYGMMVGTTLMCLILGWDGTYSRLDGALLLTVFAAYMYWLYKDETQQLTTEKVAMKRSVGMTFFLAGMGLIALIASSSIIIKSADELVKLTGLGGSLIGVISLGIASALPEMLTALSGLKNKAQGISVGTLIGSNITNPLLAIGLGAAISTYFVPRPLVYWDLPMETVTAALLLAWLLMRGRKLTRAGGIYLICLYIVYIVVRVFVFNVD